MKTTRGFTLLEVMIALAIAGGTLVVLLYSISYHLGVAGDQQARTVASLLCKQQLDSLKSKPDTVKDKAFETPYEDYKYTTTIAAAGYDGLSLLTATVNHDSTAVTLREIVRTEALGK